MRWTSSRKAKVLQQIENGTITEADAWNKWKISAPELTEWRRAFAERGLHGLKTTKLPRRRTIY